MRKYEVSTTFTVFFDGQFWVGAIERGEEGRLAVCRVIFGAEPSVEEVYRLILDRWNTLRFCDPVSAEGSELPARNPKRRQREAAKELARRGGSTKAQQALAAAREQRRADVAAERARCRKQRERARHQLKQEKRKQRHRGH